MFNNRREPRNLCYLRAEIYTDPSSPPIMAEAHDISETGIRLKVLNARTLPPKFWLSIPRRHFREFVEIKRRGDGEVGVVIHRIEPSKVAGQRR
ncbi:hypothetical protein [Rhabdaerophilum sp. SD176]|uniref:hypothetical protein n=1 Tax=Rhabdaerophilum sp. SD176 TaxID=2983548 RepID=UPI0024E0272F|nr:hypothetical protein [Rhabdaerophilum sp. SD176]